MAGRTIGRGCRRCGTPPIAWARCSRLTRASAEYVSCFGSGTIRPELAKKYNSPFAVETAHIKLKDSDLTARIIRSLFDTARQYRESIDVYGSKKSFEWTLIEHEPHILHTAKLPEPKIPKKIQVPDFAKRLPSAIRPFTTKGVYESARQEIASELCAGRRPRRKPSAPRPRDPHRAGRGSRSIPKCQAIRQLDCVGLCAHESALAGGKIVKLPAWSL